MTKYIIRLDDAHSQHDQEKWDRIECLLDKHQVLPIVAVIPDNKDKEIILENCQIFDIWEKVRNWESKGWKIAIHGLNHSLNQSFASILFVAKCSEFSGKKLEEQTAMIEEAITIFKKNGCNPTHFVAPSHGFDLNTLTAIKQASLPLVVSDSFGYRPITRDGIRYIPQQFWRPRKMPFGTWTICLHPAMLSETEYVKLDQFLSKHRDDFSFDLDQISFVPYSPIDKLWELVLLTSYRMRNFFKKCYKCISINIIIYLLHRKIFKTTWFDDNPATSFATKYLQSPTLRTVPLMVRTTFNTLIIDLNMNEEHIIMGCTSNCRNEIRRGGREALLVTHGSVTAADANFFDYFLSSKHLGKFNMGYINNSEAIVSSIYRNNCRIASHLYLLNKTTGRVRLIYSAVVSGQTLAHLKLGLTEGGMSAARFAGIANRYLHSEDILYFKHSGFNVYDFGGLGNDESNIKVKGINDFKRSFGGEVKSEFNYTPVLVVALENAIKLIRKILK